MTCQAHPLHVEVNMRALWFTVLVAACAQPPVDEATAPPAPRVAHGRTVHALVELTPDGPILHDARFVEAPVTAPEGPALATLDVLDDDGQILGTVDVPDLRGISVIDPDGDTHHGGHGLTLARSALRVPVPWPDGAMALRLGEQTLVPAPSLRPIGGAPLATRILGTGPSSERLDLLLLGDGYRASQAATFQADADRMVQHLLTIEPYASYGNLFNVWRYLTPSPQSGADHPERTVPTYVDTTYDCAYDCAGTDRLICCDYLSVLVEADRVLPGADGIMVLVNDPVYGGSGSAAFGTTYTGTLAPEVFAHEMGHTLLGLWDEYNYGGTWSGSTAGPNCETQSSVPTWSQWVGTGGVGAFTPCSYDNLYRPTTNACMMNTLQDVYCPVCREQAVREIYRRLPGVVVSTSPPAGAAITLPTTVSALTPLGPLGSGPWTWTWSLDGQPLGIAPTVDLGACDQGTLRLDAVDPTTMVRSDPQALLEAHLTWSVAIPCGVADLDQDGSYPPEDCDDADPDVFPGARELPHDQVDQNCDGLDGLVLDTPSLRAGQPVSFHMVGSWPNARVWLAISTVGPGQGPCPPALGACAGVRSPTVMQAVADADGVVRLDATVPARLIGQTVWFQPVQLEGGAPQLGPVVSATVLP